MKKILYLSQLFPSPPDSGGKIKTLNTLLALAKKHRIFAIFISEEKPSQKNIAVLTRAGITVKIFYSRHILESVKDDLFGLFKNFARGIPHYVFQYTHTSAGRFIQKIIVQFQPDIIHIDHLNMAQYLPKRKKQTWVLEHHNVETYLYWTRFAQTTKLSRKIYLLLEMTLTYFFEKKTLPLFDHVYAISKPEMHRVRRMFQLKQVSVQPLVFPSKALKKIIPHHPFILFIGGLGWPPNEDAVEYFLRDIFPKVLHKYPQAQFHVVGRSHPPFEKTLPPQTNVTFHGYQANLDPFLAKTTVFVLPIRMGGGVRLKALTALASGTPLVSTSLGVDGLEVHHAKECFIVNESNNFAQAVVQVIGSKKLRNRLRQASLRYIKQFHNQDGNKKFIAHYEKITARTVAKKFLG